MIRWSCLAMVVLGLVACRREPAIVIRFEPADLAGARAIARPAEDLAVPSSVDAALALAPTKAGDKAAAPSKHAECQADADCAIVPDGCCSCANGGKQRAVGKKAEAAARAAQRTACKDVMCTMMVSTDPTCGKRVSCVEGSCAMREARPEERGGKLAPPQ